MFNTTLKHNNMISNYTLNPKHYTLNHTNNFVYYLFNLKSLLFYILLTSLSCQNELLIYFQLKNLLCFLYPILLHIDTPSIYSPFPFLLHTNRRTMCCVWVSFGVSIVQEEAQEEAHKEDELQLQTNSIPSGSARPSWARARPSHLQDYHVEGLPY